LLIIKLITNGLSDCCKAAAKSDATSGNESELY
jgi:hypothetical protein